MSNVSQTGNKPSQRNSARLELYSWLMLLLYLFFVELFILIRLCCCNLTKHVSMTKMIDSLSFYQSCLQRNNQKNYPDRNKIFIILFYVPFHSVLCVPPMCRHTQDVLKTPRYWPETLTTRATICPMARTSHAHYVELNCSKCETAYLVEILKQDVFNNCVDLYFSNS